MPNIKMPLTERKFGAILLAIFLVAVAALFVFVLIGFLFPYETSSYAFRFLDVVLPSSIVVALVATILVCIFGLLYILGLHFSVTWRENKNV